MQIILYQNRVFCDINLKPQEKYLRTKTNKKTGGQILVECLIKHSTDRVFCVPGESYLGALDAFYDFRKKIKLVNAKHEASASNMAEAYGKLTGNPGIAFVTAE